MEKSELVVLEVPELKAIEDSKAIQIKKTFEPMAEMLLAFEKDFIDLIKEAGKEITEDITYRAKRLRLDIGKVRIETGKIKDNEKAEYLRASKAIQGVHNILVWAVTDKENKLKEIEDYFIIQEQDRLKKLQTERVKEISKYIEDANERDLSSMDIDVWNAFFGTKKQQYEDRIAAEKKAESDRIAKEKAEALERERIRKENETLKQEAVKREKLEAERIEKEKKDQLVREEKARKERESYESKIKKEREEREKVEREERIKREKLETEIKAKKESEIKAKQDAEAKEQAELNKGDKAKVKDLIIDLAELKLKYSFKSVKNVKMYSDVGLLIDKVIDHINA